MKKLVALVGSLVIGCMSLFAFGEYQNRVCQLNDAVLMKVSNNYNFVDRCSARITETCALSDGDIFIFFNGDNNMIEVYSQSEECSIRASDCVSLIDSCVAGIGMTLYKL